MRLRAHWVYAPANERVYSIFQFERDGGYHIVDIPLIAELLTN